MVCQDNPCMDITKVFGDNVRFEREKQGWTQEKLAEIAGLHRTYIGSVERGERNITLLNAEKIACALGVLLSELIK